MPTTTNRAAVQRAVRNFDFDTLFIEELGWNRRPGYVTVTVGDHPYRLQVAAEKGDVPVLLFTAAPGEELQSKAIRAKILRQVRKNHLWSVVIFTDAAHTAQIWQWEIREPGKPVRQREIPFYPGLKEERLAQLLPNLDFPLDLEDEINHLTVVARLEDASKNAEKVTKKFYDRFQKEHGTFLKFIDGIPVEDDRRWYASLMLNRLMFVYFIQKKGFLDNDHDYLRNRLAKLKAEHGDDRFYSFYRAFLLRLFHQGLNAAKTERTPEIAALLGDVPYLNGGFFDEHQLEQDYPEIHIPDNAFEQIFAFFDDYNWYLDDTPLENDNEINPDVLGYIFEKYVNQKQMGAYYTKEDITEYIGKNTIVPWLFDAAKADCAIAFQPGSALWRLLQEDPDAYIYLAVRHGTELPLPDEIAAGVPDVTKRGGWNRPAPSEYALPTETWREAVARRQRYQELWDRLVDGGVTAIDDLVTLNLDIHLFAQDTIATAEGPELLRAFWKALRQITVLDPTCGSGAFLFAAVNLLEPLYEACLDRMRAFVSALDASDEPHSPRKYQDFRAELARMEAHPSRRYFILKSIVLDNLYGVDIMEEAVEICKLRLFLKLVAQLETAKQIEPLPDIDFNIRAGNTLVGYATKDAVERALTQTATGQIAMDLGGERRTALARFHDDLLTADLAYQRFRAMQEATDTEAEDLRATKAELKRRQRALSDQLDRCLAIEHGIDPGSLFFAGWKASHQPFHWFVEYYRIMDEGGFDTVIGNPPYLPIRDLKGYQLTNYRTIDTGNLYAVMLERCAELCASQTRQGYIVPVSSISTDGYASLQKILEQRSLHFSSFDDRPSRLFDGLEHIRVTVLVIGPRSLAGQRWSTRYNKWAGIARPILFPCLQFQQSTDIMLPNSFLKLSSPIELGIVSKLRNRGRPLSLALTNAGKDTVQYSRKVGYFLQILDFEPLVVDDRGERRPPSEFKQLRFGNETVAACALASLNSSLFYWFITVCSDCRHLNKREVEGFPADVLRMAGDCAGSDMKQLAARLMTDIQTYSEMKTMRFGHGKLDVQHIYPKHSKTIIDAIDRTLADHFGFTDEELDFIINYDIKYRMGRDSADGTDEA